MFRVRPTIIIITVVRVLWLKIHPLSGAVLSGIASDNEMLRYLFGVWIGDGPFLNAILQECFIFHLRKSTMLWKKQVRSQWIIFLGMLYKIMTASSFNYAINSLCPLANDWHVFERDFSLEKEWILEVSVSEELVNLLMLSEVDIETKHPITFSGCCGKLRAYAMMRPFWKNKWL